MFVCFSIDNTHAVVMHSWMGLWRERCSGVNRSSRVGAVWLSRQGTLDCGGASQEFCTDSSHSCTHHNQPNTRPHSAPRTSCLSDPNGMRATTSGASI